MKKLMTFLILSLIVNISITAQDETQTLDLIFVGDIMGHSPQIKSAYNADTKSYDYNPCFKYVKPIIEAADLAIGNLEVTLSDQGRYTGYPMFRSPDALAYALKNAGFDMLVTSNNHSNDNGAYGVTHTLDVLDNLGFYHTGTFRNQEEKEILYPLIAYKNDFRLAFLNYTYGTNGMPTVAPTVVNEIDEATIKADLEIAKKLKPDAIIVIMHWGAEYQLNESKEQ
ncbi:MAG: CapA family protein, partial [Saprospiraceae bacterium]